MATSHSTSVILYFMIMYFSAVGTIEFFPYPLLLSRTHEKVSNEVKDLGCRQIINKEAFLMKKHPRMTSLWCTKACWIQRYTDALLKGTECWCNDRSRLGAPVPESECNVPCPGSGVEKCGGINSVSAMKTGYLAFYPRVINQLQDMIYQDMATNMKYKNADIVKYDHGSCVKWKPEKKLEVVSKHMTVNVCLIACTFNLFIYALLSNGEVCTCTAYPFPVEASPEELVCDKKCVKEVGSKYDNCGGQPGIYSVYMTGRFSPSEANFGEMVLSDKPLKQDFKPFLSRHPKIAESLAKRNPFELEESKVSTLVTIAVSLSVVLAVLVILCVCILLRRRRRNKESDYAPVEEEINLTEIKKMRESESKSQRSDRPKRKRSPSDRPKRKRSPSDRPKRERSPSDRRKKERSPSGRPKRKRSPKKN